MTETAQTPSTLNSFVAAGAAALSELVVQANGLADKLVAAGNSQMLVHQFRNDAETEDDAILKFRQWLDAANTEILKRTEAIDAYIVEKGYVDTTPIDTEAVTTQYKTVAQQVRDMRKTLASFPGAEDALKDVPELKAAPGTGRGGANTTGIMRPRFAQILYRVAGTEEWQDAFTEVDKDGTKVRKTNLTILSQVLGKGVKDASVSAKDLQEAMYSAAGTKDLSAPVEFAFGVGDKNYEIRVTPRSAE